MEIIASSLQKTGDFFLHAGYASMQGIGPYMFFGGLSFIGVACVLEYCKSNGWISKNTATMIAIVYVVILFILIGVLGHAPPVRPG